MSKKNILIISFLIILVLVVGFFFIKKSFLLEKPLTIEEKENILKELGRDSVVLTNQQKQSILSEIKNDSVISGETPTKQNKLEILNSLKK